MWWVLCSFLTLQHSSQTILLISEWLFYHRLQYFAQGCQVYIKQLRLSLQGKTGPALQEEENKIKIVALRTTSNINAVIKVGQRT